MNETIVLGSGCFWCAEAVFRMQKGVVKIIPGYAGGRAKSPTYEAVCTGKTGHAEVVEVVFDPALISLDSLLGIFFKSHDPTSLNRQGNDVGTQYRSVIFCSSDAQMKKVKAFMKNIQGESSTPLTTEVKRLEEFYPAEDYHHDYFRKNPLQPYCLLVIRPKVEKMKKLMNS